MSWSRQVCSWEQASAEPHSRIETQMTSCPRHSVGSHHCQRHNTPEAIPRLSASSRHYPSSDKPGTESRTSKLRSHVSSQSTPSRHSFRCLCFQCRPQTFATPRPLYYMRICIHRQSSYWRKCSQNRTLLRCTPLCPHKYIRSRS